MRSIINKGDSASFDSLVKEFVETNNSELLEDILVAGKRVVAPVRYNYADLNLDETFDGDMVLEFLQRHFSERTFKSPTRSLRNIADNRIKELIEEAEVPSIDSFDAQVYSMDVNSKLILEESLEELFIDMPLRIRAGILFLIYYPEESANLQTVIPSLVDYFLVLQGIDKLRDMVETVSEEPSKIRFKLPDTQVARLLMVSSLYKVSPATLVLLMQSKSLTNVLQFCTLFGGQTVEIPTVAELSRTIQSSSELAARLEDKDLSVSDKDALAYLASDLDDVSEFDEESSLNPVLSTFFEKIFSKTVENYDNFQKQLFASVDRDNDDDIMRVYDILNKELSVQIQLITEISGSLEGREEIEKIMSILTKNSKKS